MKYWGSKSLSGSSDLWLTKNRILGVSIPTLMLLALVGGEDNFYISYQLRKMQPHSQIWQYYTVIMYLPVWINSHDANCFSVLKRNEFDFYKPIPWSKLIGQISCWRSSPTFNFKLLISAKMCTTRKELLFKNLVLTGLYLFNYFWKMLSLALLSDTFNVYFSSCNCSSRLPAWEWPHMRQGKTQMPIQVNNEEVLDHKILNGLTIIKAL